MRKFSPSPHLLRRIGLTLAGRRLLLQRQHHEAEIGAEPTGNSAEQMAEQVKSETEKFARLVRQAKVTIE